MEGRSQEMVAPFVREIMIIEQLRHSNIIKYLVCLFINNIIIIPSLFINKYYFRAIVSPKTITGCGCSWNIVPSV